MRRGHCGPDAIAPLRRAAASSASGVATTPTWALAGSPRARGGVMRELLLDLPNVGGRARRCRGLHHSPAAQQGSAPSGGSPMRKYGLERLRRAPFPGQDLRDANRRHRSAASLRARRTAPRRALRVQPSSGRTSSGSPRGERVSSTPGAPPAAHPTARAAPARGAAPGHRPASFDGWVEAGMAALRCTTRRGSAGICPHQASCNQRHRRQCDRRQRGKCGGAHHFRPM